jgi:hypothetical protein
LLVTPVAYSLFDDLGSSRWFRRSRPRKERAMAPEMAEVGEPVGSH